MFFVKYTVRFFAVRTVFQHGFLKLIGAFCCASVGDDWMAIFDYGVADFDRHDFAENGLSRIAS